MEYEIKRVVEEIDLLRLSKDEYDKLNEFYKEIVSKRYPQLAHTNQIFPVKKVIMTDDLSRIEVLVSLRPDDKDNTGSQ